MKLNLNVDVSSNQKPCSYYNFCSLSYNSLATVCIQIAAAKNSRVNWEIKKALSSCKFQFETEQEF